MECRAARWHLEGGAVRRRSSWPLGGMTLRRTCLREPISDIYDAAKLLDQAASAHLEGRRDRVIELLHASNLPAVREWVESLWGADCQYVPANLVSPRGADRTALRMPNAAIRRELHQRDGYQCRFCGIPVIRAEVRKLFHASYPECSLWGRRNVEQHAAFQAMWAQYDHVVPHCGGGDNALDNLIVTCAPCNFAKMQYTLEQLDLLDPRDRPPRSSDWDGLERVLVHAARETHPMRRPR